jgi:hypothetical protein
MMIERAKVLLYAKGLPLRLREFALEQATGENETDRQI